MKPSLLITSNIPSPYFLNYLNCLSNDYEIDVVFELKNAKDRIKDWTSSFNPSIDLHIHYLKSIRIGSESGLSFGLSKYVKKKKFDRIIVANPTTPSGILFIHYLKRHKVPFCIQSEGGFAGSGKGIKESFKKHLMSGAVFYLTGMGGNDDYFLKYGATRQSLKKYYFTSLFKSEIEARKRMQIRDKACRNELGIPLNKFIIISVGRVIPIKGYDFLIDVVSHLDSNRFECYIIGGKPTQEMARKIEDKKINNIHFIDFVNSTIVSKYYQAADLFVFTTRGDTWGLVINEAMSYGLPVITSNMAIAARYLIKNDVNGYLCDPYSLSGFVNSINGIINNKDKYKQMRNNNLETIKDYYLENMANQISYYLKEEWCQNE